MYYVIYLSVGFSYKKTISHAFVWIWSSGSTSTGTCKMIVPDQKKVLFLICVSFLLRQRTESVKRDPGIYGTPRSLSMSLEC